MKIFPFLAIGISLSLHLQGVESNSATMTAPTTQSTAPAPGASSTTTSTSTTTTAPTLKSVDPQISDQDLQQSLVDSNAWLKLVDQNKFDDSWNNASTTLKMIMSQKEWSKYLDKVRKPLGNATARGMVQQRTAVNPPGVPQGEYVVIFYQTNYANKKGLEEIILIKESDGKWRPMSYYIKEVP
jgi:Protein of unknown function (DUF4019)